MQPGENPNGQQIFDHNYLHRRFGAVALMLINATPTIAQTASPVRTERNISAGSLASDVASATVAACAAGGYAVAATVVDRRHRPYPYNALTMLARIRFNKPPVSKGVPRPRRRRTPRWRAMENAPKNPAQPIVRTSRASCWRRRTHRRWVTKDRRRRRRSAPEVILTNSARRLRT